MGRHLKTIAWVAGIIIVCLVAILAAQKIQAGRSDRALQALYDAQKLPPGTGEQQSALEKIAKDYPKTTSGSEAMMFLGNLLLKRGDHQAALDQFQELVKNTAGKPLFRIAALYRIAETQKAMGKLEDAAKTYLEAAGDMKNMDRAGAFMEAAICFEELKQKDEAVKYYKQAIDLSKEGRSKLYSEERIIWLSAN